MSHLFLACQVVKPRVGNNLANAAASHLLRRGNVPTGFLPDSKRSESCLPSILQKQFPEQMWQPPLRNIKFTICSWLASPLAKA